MTTVLVVAFARVTAVVASIITVVVAVIMAVISAIVPAVHAVVVVVAAAGGVSVWMRAAILDEVHRLVTGVVLTAVAGPLLVVPWGHAHVDGALAHAVGALVDDDRLRVDQHRPLVPDVHTAVETWLVDTDAHADIGSLSWRGHHEGGCQRGGRCEAGHQRAEVCDMKCSFQKTATRAVSWS